MTELVPQQEKLRKLFHALFIYSIYLWLFCVLFKKWMGWLDFLMNYYLLWTQFFFWMGTTQLPMSVFFNQSYFFWPLNLKKNSLISELYMIEYRTIFFKSSPFWILNEELQEQDIQIQMKTKIHANPSQLLWSVILFWIFPLWIFLVAFNQQKGRNINIFSCSVPYHT